MKKRVGKPVICVFKGLSRYLEQNHRKEIRVSNVVMRNGNHLLCNYKIHERVTFSLSKGKGLDQLC